VTPSGQSNAAQARKLAEEVVARDDCTLKEAILADAIGHLADELEAKERSLRAVYARLGP
jgi:hypothetical protein